MIYLTTSMSVSDMLLESQQRACSTSFLMETNDLVQAEALVSGRDSLERDWIYAINMDKWLIHSTPQPGLAITSCWRALKEALGGVGG